MKKAIANNIEYVYDVGRIDEIKCLRIDWIEIIINGKLYTTTCTPNGVIYLGYVNLYYYENENVYTFKCNDPRIIYIYLWNLWRNTIGESMGVPEIPNMEEAREWVSNTDITPIPVERREEIPTEKMKKFLFGGKDWYEVYSGYYLSNGDIIYKNPQTGEIYQKERWKE